MCSRSDAYFGNALVFNQSVFDETKKYWTDDWVTVKMAAKARLARIRTSNATNPTYQLSPLGDAFTYGESAAYVVVFGDKSKGRVKRSWVKWLFGKPASRFCVLGFSSPPPYIASCTDIGRWMVQKLTPFSHYSNRTRRIPPTSRLAQTVRAVSGRGSEPIHG